LDKVHLCKGLVASGLLDIEDGDDIFVVEVPQQLHLTQGSQTEHGVVKGSDLLDRNLLPTGLVQRRAIRERSAYRIENTEAVYSMAIYH
jgi:hypothetical protein